MSDGTGRGEIMKIDATVDKNDLVAIKVAEVECQLMKREEEIKAAIEARDKENEELKKDVAKEIEAAGKERIGTMLKKVAAAIEALAGKNMQTSIVPHCPCDHREQKTFPVSVRVFTEETNYFTTTVTADIPPTAIEKMKKIVANAEANDKAMEDICLLRGKLSKIPTIERAVRGELAKRKLQAEGQDELLRSILSVDLPGIIALPAPKKGK